MAFLAELEAAVQRDWVALHLIALASSSATKQVECGARRQQALVLLPAVCARAAVRPRASDSIAALHQSAGAAAAQRQQAA